MAALFWFGAGTSHAQDPRNPSAALAEAETVLTRDHARLVVLLDELHHEQTELTPAQQRHLQFLDAWSAAFVGDYPRADRLFRGLADQAGDPALSTGSSIDVTRMPTSRPIG